LGLVGGVVALLIVGAIPIFNILENFKVEEGKPTKERVST